MTAATDRLKKKRVAIHVARRQLDLDDATYRALLRRAAGVNSSADINTFAKADAVLDELSRIGFQHKPRAAAGVGRHPGAPATLGREPSLQKIEALLADMELPWAYAEAIAENITGGKKPTAIKRLEWVREAKHLRGIIAALSAEKSKRLRKMRDDLGVRIASVGLTPEWAQVQAEAMGRLAQPWPWYDCLETMRLIAAALDQRAAQWGAV